jgi:hypothetical protein
VLLIALHVPPAQWIDIQVYIATLHCKVFHLNVFVVSVDPLAFRPFAAIVASPFGLFPERLFKLPLDPHVRRYQFHASHVKL